LPASLLLDEVLLDEVLLDEVLLDEVLLDEVLLDEVLLDEVLLDEIDRSRRANEHDITPCYQFGRITVRKIKQNSARRTIS
jgi:hypothetical protein